MGDIFSNGQSYDGYFAATPSGSATSGRPDYDPIFRSHDRGSLVGQVIQDSIFGRHDLSPAQSNTQAPLDGGQIRARKVAG